MGGILNFFFRPSVRTQQKEPAVDGCCPTQQEQPEEFMIEKSMVALAFIGTMAAATATPSWA
jgi:hypothetical protein